MKCKGDQSTNDYASLLFLLSLLFLEHVSVVIFFSQPALLKIHCKLTVTKQADYVVHIVRSLAAPELYISLRCWWKTKTD